MPQFVITSANKKRALWAYRNPIDIDTDLRDYYNLRFEKVRRETPSTDQINLSIEGNKEAYDFWEGNSSGFAFNLGRI